MSEVKSVKLKTTFPLVFIKESTPEGVELVFYPASEGTKLYHEGKQPWVFGTDMNVSFDVKSFEDINAINEVIDTLERMRDKIESHHQKWKG